MNLTNYFWYFQSAIPPRVCDDIVRYGHQLQDQMAVTGGYGEGKNLNKKQKDLFANTMDPGIPKDRIADFYNYGGNDNQGIASLPYMYPTIQPQEEVVEEPEEISFYDILRQNLGLV
jgi:hypothetical protein